MFYSCTLHIQSPKVPHLIKENCPVPTKLLGSLFHIQLLSHKTWIESWDKAAEQIYCHLPKQLHMELPINKQLSKEADFFWRILLYNSLKYTQITPSSVLRQRTKSNFVDPLLMDLGWNGWFFALVGILENSFMIHPNSFIHFRDNNYKYNVCKIREAC